MRINHQNFSNSKRNFAPTAVLTKSGIVPISTARQSSSIAAAPVSAARPINTTAPKPLVNVAKPRQNALQKSLSLSRRPFYQQTALKNRNLNNKVNTANVNSVNTTKGNRVTSVVGKQKINAVKSSTYWVWRPKLKVQDHVSKNSRSYICKRFDYVDPEGRLKPMGKFNGKSDEGIFVGYSTISKSFRVYNTRTRKVEENLHITFLENKPMVTGTNSNDFASKGASFATGQSSLEIGPNQDYILMPLWKDISLFESSLQDSYGHNKDKHGPSQESELILKRGLMLKAVLKIPSINIATPTYADYLIDPLMPHLEDTGILMMLMMIEMRALDDESWVEAMQEKLLQSKLLNVWTLVDLPHGKRAIETKWVFRNKRDQRWIIVRNRARLTKIHMDNENAICVVKNPIYHSKTKHIEIRHHFIRDSYQKRLIEIVKIHTDYNVADLLTKAFDVTSLDFINTTNCHQFTMSNRQERIGYSRANGDCSKTINSVKQIHAIVDGKAVVISESSV
nr:putative ribonuclease H-like domain-containing protein [Tanacetum cinerariifolium]